MDSYDEEYDQRYEQKCFYCGTSGESTLCWDCEEEQKLEAEEEEYDDDD